MLGPIMSTSQNITKTLLRILQLQGNRSPRLGDITAVILEELSSSSPSFGTGSDPSQVRHIVEGLLAHFFSLHQSSYHPDDIRWLLEMANLQTHWQATYLMSEIVEVCVCMYVCACVVRMCVHALCVCVCVRCAYVCACVVRMCVHAFVYVTCFFQLKYRYYVSLLKSVCSNLDP